MHSRNLEHGKLQMWSPGRWVHETRSPSCIKKSRIMGSDVFLFCTPLTVQTTIKKTCFHYNQEANDAADPSWSTLQKSYHKNCHVLLPIILIFCALWYSLKRLFHISYFSLLYVPTTNLNWKEQLMKQWFKMNLTWLSLIRWDDVNYCRRSMLNGLRYNLFSGKIMALIRCSSLGKSRPLVLIWEEVLQKEAINLTGKVLHTF